MPAARWGSALLAAGAVVLTSCSTYTEVSVHSSAYQQGVIAGREARHHHRHYFRHATPYERAAFCIKHAITDIQHMSGSPLNWTEGFEHGCRLAVLAATVLISAVPATVARGGRVLASGVNQQPVFTGGTVLVRASVVA